MIFFCIGPTELVKTEALVQPLPPSGNERTYLCVT